MPWIEEPRVRTLVVIVLLLAALKVGYQEYAYRAALADVVVNTFRPDATLACEREAKNRNLSASYLSWKKPEAVALSVGRDNGRVDLFSLGDSMWSEKARDPYLVLTARSTPFRIVCEFDIVRQIAQVSRE